MTAPQRPPRTQPENLRLGGMVISLTVRNLAASLDWYVHRVGFHPEEAYEHDGQVRGYTLVAGKQRVLINQDDGARGVDRAKGLGARFYLETTQDVDRVAANIQARGGVLASEPEDMPWGARAFNLVDPDGYAFTIMSEL